MTLQEAIQHCRKQVQEQAKKGCYSCAEEHQQLAEWLKELKAYRDARAEINQALYDDARGEQNDYERGRKSGIFLCESIISVKLGESRSEIPNTCGDAISRQVVLEAIEDDKSERYSCFASNNDAECFKQIIRELPSVTPQQKMGRWKFTVYDANRIGHYECSECHWNVLMNVSDYCPHCGAKMEVEE